MSDKVYSQLRFQLSEIEHRYGQNMHILSNPMLFSYLSTLCYPETKQPQINELTKIIYEGMLQIVVNNEFPRKTETVSTRMAVKHPREASFSANMIDR